MRLISGMHMVYFTVNDTGETPFPMVDELSDANIRVVGVMAHDNASLIIAPSGVGVLSPALAANVTVTLNQGNDERLKDIPFRDLVRNDNRGVWYEFEPFRIDLTKCSLRSNGTGLGGAAPCAFTFAYIRV